MTSCQIDGLASGALRQSMISSSTPLSINYQNKIWLMNMKLQCLQLRQKLLDS